ncbi:MAG: HAMP domain-containing histidine kinase [Acetobacteraceae bacterium]|nr:HAMP domain-containing histidine kinase [Acetobacteraceae bacterium]
MTLHDSLLEGVSVPLHGGWGVALISCVAACGAYVIAGWKRRAALRRRWQPEQDVRPADANRFELAHTPFSTDRVSVDSIIREVLRSASNQAGRYSVRLELAVPPGLEARTDPRVLRQVLGDLVGLAIPDATGGRVLVAAGLHGGRVQISVSDDGIAATEKARKPRLRDVGSLIALQGGTIEMDARSGEGTTVLIRLPEPGPITAEVSHRPAAGEAVSTAMPAVPSAEVRVTRETVEKLSPQR